MSWQGTRREAKAAEYRRAEQYGFYRASGCGLCRRGFRCRANPRLCRTAADFDDAANVEQGDAGDWRAETTKRHATGAPSRAEDRRTIRRDLGPKGQASQTQIQAAEMTRPADIARALRADEGDSALELRAHTNPDNLIVWPGRRCSALASGRRPAPSPNVCLRPPSHTRHRRVAPYRPDSLAPLVTDH